MPEVHSPNPARQPRRGHIGGPNCRIFGRVVDAVDHEPLSGAVVALSSVLGYSHGRTDVDYADALPGIAVTDLDGRWAATVPDGVSYVAAIAVPSFVPG